MTFVQSLVDCSQFEQFSPYRLYYKNIHDEIGQKVKNVFRILPSWNLFYQPKISILSSKLSWKSPNLHSNFNKSRKDADKYFLCNIQNDSLYEIHIDTIDFLMLEFSLTIIEQLAHWKNNVASVKTSKFDENVVNIVTSIVTESAFFNIGGWK